MGKFIDPTRDHMQGIRDIADAREASALFFASQQEHVKKHGPVAGGRYPRAGQSGYPGGCATPRTDPAKCRAPGTGNECGSILGFNSVFGTVQAGVFPLVGGNTSATLRIDSGNASRFRGESVFFECRDAAAGFGVVPGLLISAFISGAEQLVGTGNPFGITSAVFALTNEPLPINNWEWENSGQQQLDLQFTNFLAAGVTIQVFGVFWGTRM
jgi:hypothetical protein